MVAFSYTGLARIDGVDTDAWLAEALASADDANASILAVKDRATAAFQRLRCPLALKSHAFIAVGWDQRPDDSRWLPWICWISNSMDDRGRWVLPPRDEFEAFSSLLLPARGKKALVLSVVGQRLKRDEHRALMRDLRRYVDHDVSPGAVSDRLVAQVRQVAARTQTVSDEVMVNAIPLLPEKFVSGELSALSARPTLDSLTFSYIPAGQEVEVELGPRGAFPGGAQLFDIRARQLGEPGDIEVIVGFKTPRRLS